MQKIKTSDWEGLMLMLGCRSWQILAAWHSLAIGSPGISKSTKIEALVQEIKKMESADSTNKAARNIGDASEMEMSLI